MKKEKPSKLYHKQTDTFAVKEQNNNYSLVKINFERGYNLQFICVGREMALEYLYQIGYKELS